MSVTPQYLQARVHRYLPFLGLTMKITQQNSGRLVDVEHNTL